MRIAIVALNAYPAANPAAGAAIGGLETFAWSLACALAKDSQNSVQFVVRVTTRPKPLVLEGIERLSGVKLLCDVELLRSIRHSVSRSVDVTPAFPWLRFHRFSPALLWQIPLLAVAKLGRSSATLTIRIEQILATAGPDVMLTLGVGDGAAAAVSAARTLGIPSWIWWQSNADLNERFLSDDGFIDPYGVTSAEAREVYRATGLICQTQQQQERVSALLNRESVVIPNPVDFERFPVGPGFSPRQEVLWIGRYDRHHKRPLLALEVARRCPGVPFHFVINRGTPDVEEEVRRSNLPNVRVTDYIPRHEMPAAFRRARLFLSTGSAEYEGFPNVFLEAASSGTPIASLEDFDRFLSRSMAGISTAGDVDQLASVVQSMWDNEASWTEFSRSGATYVRRYHSLEECVRQFRDVTSRLSPKTSPKSPLPATGNLRPEAD